jgi:hypothetical protein
LLGKLDQPNLVPDYLLFLCHLTFLSILSDHQ